MVTTPDRIETKYSVKTFPPFEFETKKKKAERKETRKRFQKTEQSRTFTMNLSCQKWQNTC